MNTNLQISQNCAFENGFLVQKDATSAGKLSAKTFAELPLNARASEVKKWLDERTEDIHFAGKVSFHSACDGVSSSDIEQAITVCENAHWKIAVANNSKTAAFSTLLVPTKPTRQLAALNDDELTQLANSLAMISTRYDNLMMASVGLSIEWHSGTHQTDSIHAVISPIVSSAPGMFGSQRFIISDFTPEQTARRLRNLSDIHFRDIFPE